MDNFEKHIRENRAYFDEFKADKDRIWAKISARLEPQKPKVIPFWKTSGFKVAAGFAILFGIAAFVGLTRLTQINYIGNNAPPDNELVAIDSHYKNLVSRQVQLIKDHPKLSSEDKDEFLSFMDELDLEDARLKLEMNKNLGNERVLEAIISNYKKRIELIENLLEQLNDSKQTEEDYGITL